MPDETPSQQETAAEVSSALASTAHKKQGTQRMCTHPAPDSVENLVILGDVAVDHTKLLWLAHCGDASLNLWINQKKKKGRMEGKDGREWGKGWKGGREGWKDGREGCVCLGLFVARNENWSFSLSISGRERKNSPRSNFDCPTTCTPHSFWLKISRGSANLVPAKRAPTKRRDERASERDDEQVSG